MSTTLVSTPAVTVQVSPEIISRWLASECPNIFQLQRKDFAIVSSDETTSSPAGCMEFTLDGAYTGEVGNIIMVYNTFTSAAHIGQVTYIDGETIGTTIPYAATFAGEYMNDHTLYNGFYFEGRITANGSVLPLTVIATPNTLGIADLDVSSVLRTLITPGIVGGYTSIIQADTNKGGAFTLEYRAVWYGGSSDYTAEGNTWYYVEAVRSIEQGSNLYEYVPSGAGDVPFFCSFAKPVAYGDNPFTISFLLPPLADFSASPAASLQLIVEQYNAANELLGTSTFLVDPAALVGRPCRVNMNLVEQIEGLDHYEIEINAV